VGISACLLGASVRFDGGHKRDPFLAETFARFVEWVPVCPEVELGLGVPRPTLRLERAEGGVRLIMPSTGTDLTAAMRRWARRRVGELEAEGLAGFVVKKDSPSCGLHRVKVYDREGRAPARDGSGLFAAALRGHFPHLPIEEEGRLHDPRLRENFVERVFAYQRLRALFAGRWTVGRLVRFHTAHKLELLSHSPTSYAELGRLVARARAHERSELARAYADGFMQALEVVATPKRHANVLQHIAGYLRAGLEPGVRQEIARLIDDYRSGLVPLIVPLTLLQHYARRLGVEYLLGQTYLDPHPRELMLRNHV
jgi:uncharacterized protein YbgA (DUF1722 family)/uncharacterized protein YbbK (DUF523 family)